MAQSSKKQKRWEVKEPVHGSDDTAWGLFHRDLFGFMGGRFSISRLVWDHGALYRKNRRPISCGGTLERGCLQAGVLGELVSEFRSGVFRIHGRAAGGDPLRLVDGGQQIFSWYVLSAF